uniref:Olfactory receptor 71 n=1 Tax=Meteorus pulchricornis TaxID=51522 RepID=A0A1S5VFQ4_9HYME|nr:olfactory receptor 71 [Meteorus pulchricornis]
MTTPRKLHEYRAFTQSLRKMMYSIGLWPVVKPTLFYRLLLIMAFIASFVACFVIFNFVMAYHSDIDTMTKGMGLGGSFINTMIKILCFAFNRGDVKELYETLDNIFNELLKDTTVQSLILKRFTAVRRLTNIFSYLVFLSIATYAVTPILHIISQHIHHVHPVIYPLALPAIYPWPISNGGLLYYFHYLFELFSAYTLFLVTCSVDGFFPIYVFQMSGLLKAMSYRLNNIKKDDDFNGAIRECAKKYAILLRCRDILETLYGPIVLWMLLSSAVVLCALTFQMSKLDGFAFGRICLIVAYMGSKSLQTYIYAWAGSLLTSEVRRVRIRIEYQRWLL